MKNSALSPVLFQQFGKRSHEVVKIEDTKNVVVYTRVSSKEQADKNLSLETQKKAIEEYTIRNGLTISAYFGGTYESAKTDGRKEFSRMLEFIKRNKRTISQLLVYSIDRFSRTGGAAIKLATDLREQYGISVFAVTQPTDTSNPSGVLHQNIQLLFSEYDNQLRKQKIVAGMKNKLEKGIWVLKAPQGYDNVTINGERKIVLNDEGKRLKKAFQWKLAGYSNTEILEKLEGVGIFLYPQQLCRIFANPFYCGYITHGLLEGKIVEGVHEKLITPEQFLHINEIRQQSPQYGVKHESENDNVPLRRFIKCDVCGTPFTGYIVKKKKLYYYKCRTKGCKCNVSAKTFNSMFAQVLETFRVTPDMQNPLLFSLIHKFEESVKGDREQGKELKEQLKEIDTNLETIEEDFWVRKTLDKGRYDNFRAKYNDQKETILKNLRDCAVSISNLENELEKLLRGCENINEIWASAKFADKEIIQNIIFPSGLVYDRKNKGFRTEEINEVFQHIAREMGNLDDNKKGLTPFLWDKSSWVVVVRRGMPAPRSRSSLKSQIVGFS